WTANGHPLPGGEKADPGQIVETLCSNQPSLPRPMIARLVFSYGTRAMTIIGKANTVEDMGTHFGADLYQAEVDYLIENEWARTTEDIIWRRSKLGLRMTEAETRTLTTYLEQTVANTAWSGR